MDAKQFAKNNGFSTARFLCEYKNMKVYEAETEEPAIIGAPQFILFDAGAFRFADVPEAFAILDSLPDDETP